MSEHTPGRIQLAKEFDGHIMTMDGLAVSDCCLDYSSLDHDQQVSNARRLVACWNALLDAPTELLERAVSAGITDVSMGNLFSSRMELQAQRDELLAALRVVQSQCESMAGADWRKWEELASPEEFERWVKSRAAHMAEQARAAIAKVEGGAV